MDAGSGRLERAADRIYLILGIYRDKMPNEAVEALQGVAAALGAAQEPVLVDDPAQEAALHLERRADEIQAGKEPASAVNELRDAARLIQTWSPNFDEIVSSGKMLGSRAAPEPAQAGGETDVEWLLRQMETQDLATLRGIAKSFPCERNGCFSDKPAQAKQGVRHG